MWTKNGCVHCVPSPQNPFTMTVSTNFSPEFSKSLSLSKIRGLEVSQLHISYIFLCFTGQLFIEQEQIYNRRRVAVLVGGRLSPGTSVLSKASLPWYVQNPLQGCRRFTGSQRDGMLVKTELKRGERRAASKPNLPYHRARCMFPKSPDYRQYFQVGLTE